MSNIKRAVVGYVEDKKFLIEQTLWLYTSLKELDCKDTDLVIFGTKPALSKLPDDIIKVISVPKSNYSPFKNYHFINSLGFFKDRQSDFLKSYDYVMRTDVDTFLLPQWKNVMPKIYMVGKGAYVNDENTKDNLHNIAYELGLNYKDKHNIGSTHYGDAKTVCEVNSLAFDIAKYIIEKYFKNDEGSWPGWYRGVVSMYANELAVNHLCSEYEKNTALLDFNSTSDNNIDSAMHIHCWQTNDLFSKFVFEKGKYDNVDINTLDKNIIKYYCLYIALKSRQYRK